MGTLSIHNFYLNEKRKERHHGQTESGLGSSISQARELRPWKGLPKLAGPLGLACGSSWGAVGHADGLVAAAPTPY